MALATYLALVLAVAIILVRISVRADRSLPPSTELPMQWGFDGRPTWSAPRKVALAFTPALYLLTMLAIGFFIPVHWGAEVPAMLGVAVFVAAAFVGVHLFHLWLIRRGGWKRPS